jgi:hypothetical protein
MPRRHFIAPDKRVRAPSPATEVLRACVALGVSAALSACGESETVTEGGAVADATVDTQGGIDGGADADAESPDAAQVDATKPDTGGPTCPGNGNDPGCPCTNNVQCASGYCIPTPKGQLCTSTCSTTCTEPGFKCVTVAGAGGGDGGNICVPQFGNLCDPCSKNEECAGIGNSDAKCVDFGTAGAFCGSSCNADPDCPVSHECKDVKDIGGVPAKQCVPKSGATCSCSEAAIKKQLTTKCYNVAGDSKCEGKRTCLPAGQAGAPPGGGLTPCLAPAAKSEECNGADDDCDGLTDESTCDDNKVCTDDKCGGTGGCKHLNNDLPCDADGSICTEKDTCQDGKCVPGKQKLCDDKNECTTDTCDPKTGCKFDNADGALCNADDNECTQKDACKDGSCTPGKPKACNSDDGCVLGKCKIDTGKCDYQFQEGAPCNDGNPCTTAEICKGDLCKGKAFDCDDKTPCTTDSCDPKTGCKHDPVAGPCDDGDKCTKADNCDMGKDAGKCVGKPIDVAKECDDSNACTVDLCDPVTGCTVKPQTGGKCDDGNSCTEGDTCKDGKCVAESSGACACTGDADCAAKEDGNLCNGTLYCAKSALPFQCKVKESTIIKCDESQNGQCQTIACDPGVGKCKLNKKPEGLECDADGSLCTKGDACKDGACAAGSVQQCDDKNVCTDDSCDPKQGCVFKPNSLPCDADTNPCTENDTCTAGTCVAGKPKACTTDDQCIDGKCSTKSGKCEYLVKESSPCNDGSPCTVNDKCLKDGDVGKCVGEAANCDDANPCTGDSCDMKAGCTHKPLPGACSDDDKCTDQDACKDGACKGVPIDLKVKCDDDNTCTQDGCDPATGCTHKAVTGACDDGNTCTDGDACQNGKCVPGSSICGCNSASDCASKEDGNLCNGTLFCDKSKLPFQCAVNPATVVKCDESQNNDCQAIACEVKTGKCKVTVQPDGLSCNADNNLCTVGDVCQTGQCMVGKVQVCDDKNACTDDACDPKKGCVYAPNSQACNADDNACTQNDACSQGTCAPGKQKTCDDNEACTQDTCDVKTGTCKYVPLTKGCSDDNVCTSGDACGDHPKTGTYTCVPGKAVNCDDQNPCTVDACDVQKGCSNTVDVNVKAVCYTGDPKTKGKGICKEGITQCGSDGKPGECKGQVLPGPKELCNGVDDTCDNVTDEGCAPTQFIARMATVSLKAEGKTYGARALVGASNVAGPSGGNQKITADYGFLHWIKKYLLP